MEVRVDRVDPLDGRELLAHRNFVRSLARELVRDAATADDVTQEAMARLLEVKRPGSIRPWLRTVARNLARRFSRRERRRAEVEGGRAPISALGASGESTAAPATDELAARLELQRRLTERVLALEPRARDVVILHFYEGKTVAEVAEQLGVPLETARTRLRRALAELRAGWNGELGGEREGLAALAMLARWAPAKGLVAAAGVGATTPLFWTGVVAMTTKAKLFAVAATLVVAAAGALALWPLRDGSKPSHSPQGAAVLPLATLAEAHAAELASPAPVVAAQRQVDAPAAPADVTHGALTVHAHFARDHAAAAEVTMVARRAGGDYRVEALRVRTDAAGTARFASLPIGRCYVRGDRCDEGKVVTIRAGETTELDFEIPLGLSFTGIVVDPTGAPVHDALVEVAPLARSDVDAEVLATTDEEGRFDVRDAPINSLISARAADFTASPMKFFAGKAGNAAEVRLELGAAGGSVDGTVVGPDGKPVVAAIVRVGAGETSGIAAQQSGAPPLPALVHCDEQGRFHAVGIKAGRQPVFARAPGFAPFQGECNVPAGATTTMRVALAAGATVRGVVRDAAGRVVKDAEVSFGAWQDFAHMRAVTSAEGLFELVGLPAGEIELSAQHEDSGKAAPKVVAVAGAIVSCDFKLSRGLELQGRVVDEAQAPVANAEVDCFVERQVVYGRTDRDGRFSIANCPDVAAMTLNVRGDDIEPLQRSGIDPKQRALELVVRRMLPATARIIGRIVTADGKPVANAQVSAMGTVPQTSIQFWPTGADGRFDIGPFSPGTWRLFVHGGDCPAFTSAPREIAANATCDMGTIQLAAGGTAIFKIDGDRATTNFMVLDHAEAKLSFLDPTAETGRRRTEPLAPGDYFLTVFGDHVAAQSVPFTIRAAAETAVELHVKPGVRQVVSIAPPTGVECPDGVRLRVARASDLVLNWRLPVQKEAPLTEELWLAPGEYTATASAAGHGGRATFIVGGDERPAVQVELK